MLLETCDRLIESPLLQEFQKAGVCHLRATLSQEAIAKLRSVIDEELENHKQKHFKFQEEGKGRFFGSQDLWRTNSVCRGVCTEGPLPRIAGEFLAARSANLFFDHLFVKEPGANFVTSWHNDLPYWPIRGGRTLSIWIALDAVTRENGPITFIEGSHKWDIAVQPKTFAEKSDDSSSAAHLRELIPGEFGDLESQKLITHEMEAGDVLVFDSGIVHKAAGNSSKDQRRRGYVIRYVQQDVKYDPRPGIHKMMLEPGLVPGESITCERYPVVWTRGQTDQTLK